MNKQKETGNEPVDRELAEEIEAGLPPAPAKPEPAKPQMTNKGGFVKGAKPEESTYNGLPLWTATYDQWFEILTMLGKNSPLCTGTQKADFCVDGVRLWSSVWDEKLAMLEKLVK